jgi:hypothetical protein
MPRPPSLGFALALPWKEVLTKTVSEANRHDQMRTHRCRNEKVARIKSVGEKQVLD